MASTLRELTHPIATTDPDTASTSDLDALGDLVGDARVVCIGEGDHGISQFHQITDRILRFLVQEKGFTAFALESGFAEGLLVDDWIHGALGDVGDIAKRGVTYRFGECAERHAQLRWMRRWNTSAPHPITFCGIDVPGSAASPGPAVRACLARLPGQAGDDELLARTDLGGHAVAARRYAAMSPSEHARLRAGIADLASRAAVQGDEIALHCAASARALDRLITAGSPSTRDEFMADTVQRLLGRGHRVVISAHNGHVQRSPITGRPTLGGLLAPELGSDMVVIATTYGNGPEIHLIPRSGQPYDWEVSLQRRTPSPTSIEALLNTTGRPIALLDLHATPTGLLAGAEHLHAQGTQVPVGDFREAFDAIIHFHDGALVPGVIEKLRADIEAASDPRGH
ncbi:erythromycin esterase family protein [Saccharopolyspora spinosa]|uniref:erythromycin esterase family protein n=1 Tax=Saccharopolyspora spinosa TaxID=60894 RepID=UPI000237886E|nr:erythromycin esterase family protein [Saccharopolyspora spinosa]